MVTTMRTIGQLARLVGVGIDTVRYYEKRGLLPPAPRRASGYRVFDDTALERLRLIKQLQDLGLSLAEIETMLSLEDATCARESDQIRSALARVERELAVLDALRTKLCDALGRCARGECTIADQIARVRTT